MDESNETGFYPTIQEEQESDNYKPHWLIWISLMLALVTTIVLLMA